MRTHTLSTSHLKIYKIVTLSLITVILAGIVFMAVYRIMVYGKYYDTTLLFIYGYMAWIIVPVVWSIKNVSYDDSSVYYDKDGYEVQIPFEDIKFIKIKTLSGIYAIHLYEPTQDGDRILFKTSLWYPFNFKKQDEKVNELMDRIDRYKQKLPPAFHEELPGYRI